jgi:GxxExxY protein
VSELQERGVKVVVEALIPVSYKGKPLNGHYCIDLLAEDAVIVELNQLKQCCLCIARKCLPTCGSPRSALDC